MKKITMHNNVYLTEDERIYLRALAMGSHATAIADLLSVSEEEVLNIRENLLLRFECTDELALGIWASKNIDAFCGDENDIVRKRMSKINIIQSIEPCE